MATDTASQETRTKFSESPLWKPWMTDIRLRQITSIDDLREYFESHDSYEKISWDIETESLDPHPDSTVGHCFAFTPKEGVYVPVRHKVKPHMNLDPDAVWELAEEHMKPPRIRVVYNYKFEGRWLRYKGVDWTSDWKFLRDVFIYVWLNDTDQLRKGLKETVSKYYNMEVSDIGEVPGAKCDKRKRGRIDFSRTDPEEATLYAAADPIWSLALLKLFEEDVNKSQPMICMTEHELLDGLLQMEDNGVMIDRAYLREGMRTLDRWVAQVEREIFSDAGYEFNIGSPSEVAKYLGEKGVNLELSAKGNPMTGKKVLENLGKSHPTAARVALYRSLEKEKGTYVTPLLEGVSDEHPVANFKFQPIGAPTGRLSGGGADVGERYCAMNVHAIPSASKYQPARARKLDTPPKKLIDLG